MIANIYALDDSEASEFFTTKGYEASARTSFPSHEPRYRDWRLVVELTKSVVPRSVPWPLAWSRSRGDLRHREQVLAPPLSARLLAGIPRLVACGGCGGGRGSRRRELRYLWCPDGELLRNRFQVGPQERRQIVSLRNESSIFIFFGGKRSNLYRDLIRDGLEIRRQREGGCRRTLEKSSIATTAASSTSKSSTRQPGHMLIRYSEMLLVAVVGVAAQVEAMGEEPSATEALF